MPYLMAYEAFTADILQDQDPTICGIGHLSIPYHDWGGIYFL